MNENDLQTEETVTITLSEYNALLHAANELQCLYIAGVDNWEWYADAMEALDK